MGFNQTGRVASTKPMIDVNSERIVLGYLWALRIAGDADIEFVVCLPLSNNGATVELVLKEIFSVLLAEGGRRRFCSEKDTAKPSEQELPPRNGNLRLPSVHWRDDQRELVGWHQAHDL